MSGAALHGAGTRQYSEQCSTRPATLIPLAAGAYGSTKRYKSFDRIRKVNDVCIIGAAGELSDFQYIMK